MAPDSALGWDGPSGDGARNPGRGEDAVPRGRPAGSARLPEERAVRTCHPHSQAWALPWLLLHFASVPARGCPAFAPSRRVTGLCPPGCPLTPEGALRSTKGTDFRLSPEAWFLPAGADGSCQAAAADPRPAPPSTAPAGTGSVLFRGLAPRSRAVPAAPCLHRAGSAAVLSPEAQAVSADAERRKQTLFQIGTDSPRRGRVAGPGEAGRWRGARALGQSRGRGRREGGRGVGCRAGKARPPGSPCPGLTRFPVCSPDSSHRTHVSYIS